MKAFVLQRYGKKRVLQAADMSMLDGLESGLDEVLADELTQQVKRGLTAVPPSYPLQSV